MCSFWLSLLVFCSISAVSKSQETPRPNGAWPDGYLIAENSTSPDGRYGVLLPPPDLDSDDDTKIVNTLVDLRTHAQLGVIQKAHYFRGYNHHGLKVHWAADSSWCVVTFEARYGFATITLVELRGATCVQTDLGEHIQKSLDAVIARQGKSHRGGCGAAYFRPVGEKILVRATDQTNPKAFAEEPTYCALFQGTFDLGTKKWVRSEGRKTDLEEMMLLESVFSEDLEDGRVFDREADRFKFYDGELNEVYRAVRRVLPAARFAALKKQQIAWIKILDAAHSDTAKIKLIAERIGELQKLAWEP